MAASKFAAYDIGYDDERFEQIVSQTLHCIICTNVIKDPVMCRHNEHIFCRGCIIRHLMNSQTCPTCMEPLTVDTLTQAPRGIRNLLAELKIRCEFFNRGCEGYIELGDLQKHVADCGFAPAVCSNEGCGQEVNKQDLLRHEMALCELRKVECHNCEEMKQEMNTMQKDLKAMHEILDENAKRLDRNENNQAKKVERNAKTVEENVVARIGAKVEVVQEQFHKQEDRNRLLQAENAEIKECLNEMTKQLERITQLTMHDLEAKQEEQRQKIAQADKMDGAKVVVAGGANPEMVNSVEMFSLENGTWTQLQPMKQNRNGASSVVYKNQLFVVGGWSQSMEKLSLKAVHDDPSIYWENLPVVLPGRWAGHSTVIFNEQMIMIGGYDAHERAFSNRITRISHVPPYTSKLLGALPQRRGFHGVGIFGNKIVVVVGREKERESVFRNVVMYDIIRQECQELAPLPYPVYDMGTVKWGEDNLIIIGGADGEHKALRTVLMYNIKTLKSHMLPDMKYKRRECVAAVVKDTVVMGGRDEKGNNLKSVESFRFDKYSWQELSEMHEARFRATAVTCLPDQPWHCVVM